MSKYIKRPGGIALCGRCSQKFPIDELYEDPNVPDLMVCKDDLDELDPYLLSPSPVEEIALQFTRKDHNIGTTPEGVITEDGDSFMTTEDGYIIP